MTSAATPNPVLALRHQRTNESIVVAFRTMSIQQSKGESVVQKRSWFDYFLCKKPVEKEPIPITIHQQTPAQVCQLYSTSLKQGLESAVIQRLKNTSKNELSPPPSNWLSKLLNYLFGGFNSLMWVAMILSFLSYQPLGSLNGGTPLIFNLGVGSLLAFVIAVSTLFYAYVDYNANEVMKSITMLTAEHATVLRDGQKKTVAAKDLYVGDVVILGLGDKVPADVYITDASFDLKFDKSLLTGESNPIPGSTECTDPNPLETQNLALSSTLIVEGSMTGIIFATGDNTVVGRVIGLTAKNNNLKTNLQKEIEKFTLIISGLALFMFSVSMLYWGVNTQKNHPGFATAGGAIINAIGCLTAFVPQGLPVCVALSLTVVARRMAEKSVLVKNLATVETVGSMSIICSDKTGTLTEGKMHVSKVSDGYVDHNSAQNFAMTSNSKAVLAVFALCNDAFAEGDKINGNATDVAILRFVRDTKIKFNDYQKVFNLPFNSKTKFMATIVSLPDGSLELYAKGAPDFLFSRIKKMQKYSGEVEDIKIAKLMEKQSAWAEDGHRVIVICKKTLGIKELPENLKLEDYLSTELNNMTLLSLVAIRDPPRTSVPPAIKALRGAGIRVFMVTGDFNKTAVSIARQVGIVTASKVYDLDELSIEKYSHHVHKAAGAKKPDPEEAPKAIVINGTDLEKLKKEHYDILFSEFSEIVFARTSPEQKMNIVEEAKSRGDSVVGVTGDGVNDAPALKTADVGFAMGAGSDVAKQAAHMILLSNDFRSILVGVENGRLVFENLKKVLLYVMPTGTYTELMTVIANVFFGVQAPLSSYLQVAFSIFNDVTMSISLMFETAESDLMQRKPRNIRLDGLINWQLFFQIYLFIGVFTWLSCFGIYFYYWGTVGFGFYDLVSAWDNWGDGYKGHSISDLSSFVSVSQGVFYVSMTVMQLGNILAIRNRRVSILESNPFYGPRKNLTLIPCVIIHLFVTCMNVYVSSAPGNPNIFAVGYVPGIYWALPIPLALGALIMDEIRKALTRAYPESVVAKFAW